MIMLKTALSFSSRRSVPLVLQTEIAECGLACLSMVATFYGLEVDLATLRRQFSTSVKGYGLSRLVDIAGLLGLEARPLRAELGYLKNARLPCILHWNMNHFVVLTKVTRRGFHIQDPARGTRVVNWEEINGRYTGVLLELIPGANFQKKVVKRSISIRTLMGPVRGSLTAVAQLLGLSLAIESIALLIPFQTQWVVDNLLASGDVNLLAVLTVAFIVLLSVQVTLAIARGWLVSWLGATINAQWASNLFSHLLKLPLDFFSKRHMGDIISRFGSIKIIQSTLTGSFVDAVLSGFISIFSLCLLFFYSAPLTFIVLAIFSAFLLLRWSLYHKLWLVTEEQLVYTARQQSELMESIRGVQAIKLAKKQATRVGRFSQVTMESAERDVSSQRINLIFSALTQAFFSLQRILLIAFGAYYTINGKLTVGMFLAYSIYADQFLSKTSILIDRLVSFKMLRLQAERIADIALEEPEKSVGVVGGRTIKNGILQVSGLSFRYSDGDPWVFKNLEFSVQAGESVAIVGPSGCGKTTLAKVLLGLLHPTKGTVFLNGLTVDQIGLDNYRELVSAVMQDDQLFAGSISENIAFFDDQASQSEIEEAAILASVHDDIASMPMGYESLVGDMGASLSGGQKQRVILARALFRKSQILVLDEATSHLDISRERLINQNINSLACTKIVIAHRPDTIAMCDRVISLFPSHIDTNKVREMVEVAT